MAINAANLKYYYSGGASNSNPSLSIGGVKSNVELSSTALNNLFDNVTGDEATSGHDEYRLLYFQNIDTDVDGLMDPVVLWIVAQPAGDDSMEVGLSAQGKNVVATAIANDYTAPAGVTFHAEITKAEGIDFDTAGIALPFAQNDYIGIWFHRHVPANAGLQASDGFQWRIEGDTI